MPQKFNLVIDRKLVRPSLAHCEQQSRGYPINHGDLEELRRRQYHVSTLVDYVPANSERMPLLLCADNYWLFATSPDMLASMADCWHCL